MRIAVVVPSTSKKREWKTATDSYLNKMLSTFRETCDSEHTYCFFIGVDVTDPYYIKYRSDFETMDGVRIIPVSVEIGYVTHIWNILAGLAFDEGFDYMFQCGDDVQLETKGWVNKCIEVLHANNNIGVTGPNDRKNTRILTQTFVHRTHYELFKFYFPPEIPNWYCDDWINEIYEERAKRPPAEYTCFNAGGYPRYTIVQCRDLCTRLVRRDKKLVNNLLGLHQ